MFDFFPSAFSAFSSSSEIVIWFWSFIVYYRMTLFSDVNQLWIVLLFGCLVLSDSLWPHRLQHTRLPCVSPSPKVCLNSCTLSQWCHPTISSSVIPFSSCHQSFPASGSFPVSQFFASGDQSIGASASASVLPVNIQGWFPLGWTGWYPLGLPLFPWAQSMGVTHFIPAQSRWYACVLKWQNRGLQTHCTMPACPSPCVLGSFCIIGT